MQNPYKNFAYDIYVDKYKVKEFVNPIIKTSKTYAYFDKAEEIEKFDYDSLPDSFVIKPTHACDRIIEVKNKKDFNKKESIEKTSSQTFHPG